MRTRFIHDDFILDVSHLELSWQEENTWFKDEFFMVSSFPFDLNYDENPFFQTYQHLNLTKPTVYFTGKLEKDGSLDDAILEIEEASDKLRMTIRYGVEALPNWTKKLSELQLEVVLPNGGNMGQHASTLINKTYPVVNYNFPAVHSGFYEGTAMFEAFEGVLNQRVKGQFVTNIIDGAATLNKNIVYPFPYHLYVLEAAIADAGYTLHGDILSDPDLLDAVIVPGKKLVEFEEIPDPVDWNLGQFDRIYFGDPNWAGEKPRGSNPIQQWYSTQEVNLRGSFRLVGQINHECQYVRIKLNGNVIFEWTPGSSLNFLLFFDTLTEINELECFVISFGITNPQSTAVNMVLTTFHLTDENGEMIPYFANFSKVHLADKLPDMTVGDFVKFHKRLKNYDFDLRNTNEIWMNLVQNEVTDSEIVDVSMWDTKNKVRRFEPEKAFILQYEDEFDDYPFTKIMADKNGFKIDEFEKTDSTEEININGIPLPIKSDKGIETAVQLTDDAAKLMLVKYNGLKNGENWTTPMLNLDCYQLYMNYWNQWLNFMIHSVRFLWTIKSTANSLLKIKRKSKLYAFNNLMFVYSLQRKRKKNIEEIEIEAYSSKV